MAQLTGTKTIPGDYPTFVEAITDLNLAGVGPGGVTFEIAADYTESFADSLILTATGTAANPIVFQKQGVGANPVITRTDGGSWGTSTASGRGDAVFLIQGGDFITWDAINLAASNSAIEYGIYMRKADTTNGCKNITIQ